MGAISHQPSAISYQLKPYLRAEGGGGWAYFDSGEQGFTDYLKGDR
jgi:hypothetical protein